MASAVNDPEFDPLATLKKNNPIIVETDDLYARVVKNKRNPDDLFLPMEAGILKTEVQKINQEETNPKPPVYNRLDFTPRLINAPVRTNPFDSDIQKSTTIIPPSKEFSTASQLHEGLTQSVLGEGGKYDENYPKDEHEEWNDIPFEEQYPEDYYYPYESDYPPPPYMIQNKKKKGIGAKLDRMIQRFPILSAFYKPPPPEIAYNGGNDNYEYSSTAAVSSVYVPTEYGEDEQTRELTNDEVILIERYSNKSLRKVIELQLKSETQPIDVCVQKELNYVYVCDAGRNIVQVYDLNGILNHVIDDPNMKTFRPTSIAVGQDGTVIVASHFVHRLQMYSPCQASEWKTNDTSNTEGFYYNQFKLGQQGHDPHQFYYPAGIRCDDIDSLLYVCDRGNSRIQIITPDGYCERIIQLVSVDGQLLAPIQLAFLHQDNSETVVCIVGDANCICFVPKYSNGIVTVEPLYIVDQEGIALKGASGLCVDQNDYIFISDTGNDRIVICSPVGSYITQFGGFGTQLGQLNHPYGICLTDDGTLVVADNGNRRVHLFGLLNTVDHTSGTPLPVSSAEKENLLIDAEPQRL
ncbi:unnamed protein product [Didymodactylos carnosus]|uniref:Uncharacterized protein n=1 Tax=Didymodactylos carnosus TaxID=1234261 RepID=A0A815BT47_9BILA|nr:unnamed protein product [Didymodactylos carnosus]CAF1274280.1 unnamed protein product [Didymodactylos carnosus]CAF3775792.1 unnamed protein product [Didymodactylos carnosus]CAF4064627.1 unnamed protein product [Didymodactylos carnosus]